MDRILAALAAMLGLATFTAPDHEQLRSEAAAAVAYAAALPAASPAPLPDATPAGQAIAKPAAPQLGDVVDHPNHGGRYVYKSLCRNGVCEPAKWHWEPYPVRARLRR